MENINFTEFVEVKDIRNYTAKVFCEDSYGKMIDTLELVPDNFSKDLYIFRMLIDDGVFRGKRDINTSIEPLLYKWKIMHQNQKYAIDDPGLKTLIELFTNVFIFEKKFKVFIYFNGYDPILNPFYGFELFSSIKEFVQVMNKFLNIDESLIWHNEKDLNEKLEPYKGGETEEEIRMNNIMRILIILFNKGRWYLSSKNKPRFYSGFIFLKIDQINNFKIINYHIRRIKKWIIKIYY